MPRITSIKPQKSKKRVNIYLDNKFGFGIDLENFVKLGLKVEQELTEEKVSEIVKKAEFQKTLDKLLGFATLRPRSEKEVHGWFRRKKVHESLQKDLLERLRHFELLDDEKFARWWVGQRLQFKSKSKKALIFELKGKGMNQNIIDDVLAEVQVDEGTLAVELLKKKDRNLPRGKAGWDGPKMLRYLGGRGFDWETARESVKIHLEWRNKTK